MRQPPEALRPVAGLSARVRRQPGPAACSAESRPAVCWQTPRGSARAQQPGPTATPRRSAPALELQMALGRQVAVTLIEEPAAVTAPEALARKADR